MFFDKNERSVIKGRAFLSDLDGAELYMNRSKSRLREGVLGRVVRE